MSFVAFLCAFALGFGVGSSAGIVLGFVWYERKSGLLSDHSRERAASIRFELDDVFRPITKTSDDWHYTTTGREFVSSTRIASTRSPSR
jgi:hypothetical protein